MFCSIIYFFFIIRLDVSEKRHPFRFGFFFFNFINLVKWELGVEDQGQERVVRGNNHWITVTERRRRLGGFRARPALSLHLRTNKSPFHVDSSTLDKCIYTIYFFVSSRLFCLSGCDSCTTLLLDSILLLFISDISEKKAQRNQQNHVHRQQALTICVFACLTHFGKNTSQWRTSGDLHWVQEMFPGPNVIFHCS